MTQMRQWIALAVAGCLALLAVAWFVVVAPKRSQAAELGEQAAAQHVTNASLETRLQVLKAQAAELPKEQAELAAVATKIPERADLPTLIRSLSGAAVAADVELTSITPSAAVLVTPPTPAAAAPVDPAADAGAAVPPAAAPATAGGPQLARIPLSISVKGGYFAIVQFLEALEEQPRALRVTNLGMAPDAADAAAAGDGRTLSATLTGEVYLAVAPAAAAAAPAPVGAPAAPVPPAGATGAGGTDR